MCTTMSCGFNMNIKRVGNINSPENSDGNVMKLFNTNQRINHCHGRRKYHPPKIKTKPFSLSGTIVGSLFLHSLDSHHTLFP